MSIELATHIASRSTFKRHRTGAAVVDKKGITLSVGWSHFSHTRMTEYFSMHAELHAILRAGPKIKDAAAIYVSCFAVKSGNLCIARPCELCMAAIIDTDIPKVYYTHRKQIGVVTL